MNGWITVALIAGTQLVIVLFLMYCASSRWWHSILILLLAVPLLRLSLLYTGDVSRIFRRALSTKAPTARIRSSSPAHRAPYCRH